MVRGGTRLSMGASLIIPIAALSSRASVQSNFQFGAYLSTEPDLVDCSASQITFTNRLHYGFIREDGMKMLSRGEYALELPNVMYKNFQNAISDAMAEREGDKMTWFRSKKMTPKLFMAMSVNPHLLKWLFLLTLAGLEEALGSARLGPRNSIS